MEFIREQKTGDDSLRLWYKRIRGQIEFLKTFWNGYDSWRAAYLLDRVVHWSEKGIDDSNSDNLDPKITIPLIATHIRNLMPFLFSKSPLFFGNPYTDDPERIARVIAQVDYLNSVWVEYGMSKQARRSILDASIIGHGIGGTGWNREMHRTSDTNKKGNLNYSDYIKEEAPFIRRVNPFQFLFDTNSPEGDLASARWCCEIIYRPFQDIIDDEVYSEKTRKKLENRVIKAGTVEKFLKDSHGSDGHSDFLFAQIHEKKREYEVDPDSLIILYKIYDKKFRIVRTMLDVEEEDFKEGELLLNDWPYDHLKGRFPFEKLDFEEVPDCPYGFGHVRYLSDIQKMLNRNRTKIYQVTRAFNPKYTHTGNEPLESTEIDKITADEFGSVINLKSGANLLPLPAPTNSRDLYQAADLLDKDYSEVSGEDVLQRGGLLTSRTSAEEIRERSRLRGLRLEANVENTHSFLLRLGDQLILHARKYLKTEKAVMVLGRPGQHFNNISPELMNEEFSLNLSVVSKDADPPEIRRRHLLELLNTIANPNIFQLLQTFKIPVNFQYIWKMILETYGINEIYNLFPGIRESSIIPPNITPFNTPSAPGSPGPFGEGSQGEIRRDNVSEESNMQGLQGFMAKLIGGQNGPQ